jgi:hypothetical protein
MPLSKYIPRKVNLHRRDHEYIWQVVEQRGLGPEGYDQVLRQIIREHEVANKKGEQPEDTKFIHPPFP